MPRVSIAPEILFIIIVWVVCAIVCGQVASKKGYAYNSYALLGLLTGIIGLIIVFVMPDKTQGKEASDAEALLAYKKLLDSGAITQEEFDEKKRSLMGK